MNKKYNLYKIFVIFIMTIFTLHIFVLDLTIPTIYTSINNKIYNFFFELFISNKDFDNTQLIIFIFIYYFYYKKYLIENINKQIKIISSILSIIISISLIIIKSLNTYANLKMITSSSVQLYKCIVVSIGYYFFIYILIREILLFLEKKIKK